MTGKQNDAFVVGTLFVETLDTLEVEVIGRLIEQDHIRILQHHSADHATHFLTTTKNICFLHNIIAAEKHFSKKTTQERFVHISYM